MGHANMFHKYQIFTGKKINFQIFDKKNRHYFQYVIFTFVILTCALIEDTCYHIHFCIDLFKNQVLNEFCLLVFVSDQT